MIFFGHLTLPFFFILSIYLRIFQVIVSILLQKISHRLKGDDTLNQDKENKTES